MKPRRRQAQVADYVSMTSFDEYFGICCDGSIPKPKSIRLDWNGKTLIAVGFLSKGKAKSSVAVQHTRLPDRETAERLKTYWSDQMENLAGVLKE